MSFGLEGHVQSGPILIVGISNRFSEIVSHPGALKMSFVIFNENLFLKNSLQVKFCFAGK